MRIPLLVGTAILLASLGVAIDGYRQADSAIDDAHTLAEQVQTESVSPPEVQARSSIIETDNYIGLSKIWSGAMGMLIGIVVTQLVMHP